MLSGPSGVGKDALVDGLREREPNRHYAITATTRPPRRSEVNGVHYLFWNEDRFEEQIKEGGVVEWARVYGHLYGVPREGLARAIREKRDTVIKVDVQGAAALKAQFPQAILIFLCPYSRDELYHRNERLRREFPEQVRRREEAITAELAAIPSFDYVVVNREGELARTVQQTEAIIAAEKSRVQANIIAL